jgi:uncharacterized protein YeaC (DUF1315 family)
MTMKKDVCPALFLSDQIKMLRKAIKDGSIPYDEKLLQEQKEGVIDEIMEYGCHYNKSEIGAIVDKLFAEYLSID